MLLPACAAAAASGTWPRLLPRGVLLPQLSPSLHLAEDLLTCHTEHFSQAALTLTVGLGDLLPPVPYVQTLLTINGRSYFTDLT